MDVAISSATLAAVVCAAVTVAILLRRPRRPLYTYFAQLSAGLCVWHAAAITASADAQGLSAWQCGAALFLPPPAILFFRALLRDRGLLTRRLARSAWGLSLALLALNFSRFGAAPSIRVLQASYVLLTLALVQRALLRHVGRARASSDRKRVAGLFFGGLVATVLALAHLAPQWRLLSAAAHLAATLYVYFLYQSIVARRLMDLVELLGKAAVLASLTLLLATVYTLLLLSVKPGQSGLWLFHTLVASFVILILYDQVRPVVEQATTQLLFRGRRDLKQSIVGMLRRLQTTLSQEQAAHLLVDGLMQSGRCERVALYLACDAPARWRCSAFRGPRPPLHLSLADQPALIEALLGGLGAAAGHAPEALLEEHLVHMQDELPAWFLSANAQLQRHSAKVEAALAAIRALGASVVLPVLHDGRVVGILVLGGAHCTPASDELAALWRLAEAAAVVVENSQAYAAQRERDRLVVVGEMAAGMAHEIRNPLGAIKGAAQCLEPREMPPQAQELVAVIVEEVDRLSGVVSQFLEYARPLRPNPVATDLSALVAATLRFLARDAWPAALELRTQFATGLPPVRVDPEHLRQVTINLLRNATEAMPRGGRLVVSTRLEAKAGQANHADPRGWVCIEVADNGEGIAKEALERIFLPFFTTKSQGTGLGLAISQRLVEAAGGRLEVHSQPASGTTCTVRLPLAPP